MTHTENAKFNLNFGRNKKRQITTMVTDLICAQTFKGLDDSSIPALKELLSTSSWSYRTKQRLVSLMSSEGAVGIAIIPKNPLDPESDYKLVTFRIINYFGDDFSPYECWGVIDDPDKFKRKFNSTYYSLIHFFFSPTTGTGPRTPHYEIWNYQNVGDPNFYANVQRSITQNPNAPWKGLDDTTRAAIQYNMGAPIYNTTTTPLAGLPVMIINNGWEQRGDWEYIDEGAYTLLDFLSNKYKETWSWLKGTSVTSEAALKGNISADEFEKQVVVQDKWLVTLNAVANGFSQDSPVNPLVVKADSLTLSITLSDYLDDYINKFTFQMRDLSPAATNKHNMETIKPDESALKHDTHKLLMLADQLEVFFNYIVLTVLSSKTKSISISIGLSDIDQNKIDSTDPSLVPKLQLEAATVRAQAQLTSRVGAAEVTAGAGGTTPAQPGAKPTAKPKSAPKASDENLSDIEATLAAQVKKSPLVPNK